jgi:hypothetical protein
MCEEVAPVVRAGIGDTIECLPNFLHAVLLDEVCHLNCCSCWDDGASR